MARRRVPTRGVAAAVLAVVGTIGVAAPAPSAQAAGIVTHAWMALDAIDRVEDPGLRALLDAQRDQVRAGAEFPDGGYWTRSFGTPGGDYGEEAHWQRFHDAYVDRIRTSPDCGDLTDPHGPCAPVIAHAFGAAAHGMGDEVWDWLFEPNGPGFAEEYLPPDWAALVGPGGLEPQLDVHAIAHHHRRTGPTPELPRPDLVVDAFAAVGRGDISVDALPVGENMLEVERGVETNWSLDHADALARAMPWTTEHLTSASGGVGFAADAIAGYYEHLWGRLLDAPSTTRVAAVAPAPGARRVPATGWVGSYHPGSNAGNQGGQTRIAAALSSALPFNAQAGGGPVDAELPGDTFRLRVAGSGAPVPAQAGYPRIVPYGPEAGEHVIAFQPAADLAPCTSYRAEVTPALLDADGRSVAPFAWTFRTSGCRGHRFAPVQGTVTCATGALVASDAAGSGAALTGFDRCVGGQDGRTRRGGALPIARGAGIWQIEFGAGGCDAFEAGTPATIRGDVRWEDGHGRVVGWSHVPPQPFDLRGATVTVGRHSRVLPGHRLALRMPTEPGSCTDGGPTALAPAAGRLTAWTDR
jgi:hypothetical protein